jgi:hypothetical protein
MCTVASGPRLALVALVFAATPQTILAESNQNLARRFVGAQSAVVGKVESVTPRWHRNQWGDELIVSRLTVDVVETLRGASARKLQIDVEGGTLGGLTLQVGHQVALEAGDRAVFILDEVQPGLHAPHGKAQGLLRLGPHDRVEGTSATLAEVRAAARAAAAR